MTYFHVINAWDTKVSMLFSLLLANVRTLSCFFFLLLVMLSNLLLVPVVREKIKAKLALVIPTGAPTRLVDEMIQTLSLAALKTIKTLSMSSKAARYVLNFLLHDIFWLISCRNNFQSCLFFLIQILSDQSSVFYKFQLNCIHSFLK